MIETSHRFGRHAHLLGVITEPTVVSRGVGVVLISAGLVPKFGHYRVYVDLARRLAREGFHTLRFDLGGIGDSHVGEPHLPLDERTALDLADAIGELTRQVSLRGVVLGGLCSGAEDAFRAAERDERVTGVVMVDPFSYRTPGWTWRHLRHRATRRTLRALGLYHPLGSRRGVGHGGEPPTAPLVSYTYMAHAESSRILAAMLARNARAHFVYTGGKADSFNHPSQLAAMFPAIDLGALVTVDHLPQLDHLQLLVDDRVQLVDAIAARLVAALQPVATRPRARVRRLTGLR